MTLPHMGLCLPGQVMLKSTQVSTSERSFRFCTDICFEGVESSHTCIRLLVRELNVAVGRNAGFMCEKIGTSVSGKCQS